MSLLSGCTMRFSTAACACADRAASAAPEITAQAWGMLDRQGREIQVVRNARGYAVAGRRVPPMLDITLFELP